MDTIDRDAEDRAVALRELGDPISEGVDLGRADEGEVQRIEEQDHVLAAVVRQADLADAAIG